MGYTTAQAKEFISDIAPYIQKYSKEYGYKVVSPIIAQAICESGITSVLSIRYFNYFGLKAGSSTKGVFGVWDGTVVKLSTKEEYTPGTLTSIKDLFRVFREDSEHTAMENGVRGYFEFLNYSRYKALKNCTTPKEFLQTIVKAGYCTSTTYVNTCMNIINKYDLTKWDADTVVEEKATTTEAYSVGKTYTTQSDLYVRSKADGSKLKYDALTQDAKAHAKYDSYGCAILCKGTKVTCKSIVELKTSTWIKNPSGWICAKNKTSTYIK